MARTYADLNPGVQGGDSLYASTLNLLRTAISRRATVAGAAVTLPDVIVAGGSPGAEFEDWLVKARQCIEDILDEAAFYAHGQAAPVPSGGTYAFAAWTKATLLDYVHTEWVTTAFVTDSEDWAPYDAGTSNTFYCCYVNEVYYACECLAITKPGLDDGTGDRTAKYGAGQDLATGGTTGLDDVGDIVAGTSQSASLAANLPVVPGTTFFALDDGGGNWLWMGDDGSGNLTKTDGSIELTSGSINYTTGAVSFVVDTALAAGNDILCSWSWGTPGSLAVAVAAAIADFNADSYAAAAAGYECTATRNYREDPPASGDFYADVGNVKVTDADVVVPDVAYRLTKLAVPWRHSAGASEPVPAATVTGGTAAGRVAAPSGGYAVGYLLLSKSSGGWDNETVSVAYAYQDADLSGSGDWFDYAGVVTDSAIGEIKDLDAEDGYGQTDFDGYSNGVYGMG